MRRSLKVKLSLIGAVLAFGALADDIKANKGKADANFVEEAYIGGQTEVRLSQLAVRQSSDPAVKQFAQQMIDDHTKANDALRQVAESKGFVLPAEMSSTTGSVGGSTDEGTVTGERMGSGDNRMGAGSTGSSGTIGNSPSGSTDTTGNSDRNPSDRNRDRSGTSGSVGSTGSTGSSGYDTSGSTAQGNDTMGGSTGSNQPSSGTSSDTYGKNDRAGSTTDNKIGSSSKSSYTGFTAAQRQAMKKYDDLAKKTGADFDKAYLSAIIDDHKKDIKLFEKESKRGDDAELKSWATNTLPTLRHHLEMAQTIEKDVKGRRTNNM